jgi:DNA-binding GntR family transcriptional regulator
VPGLIEVSPPTMAEGSDGTRYIPVFEAIERRDPDAAATAMGAHMESASARLARSLR